MRSDTGPGGTSRGSNWSLRGAIGELEVLICWIAVINNPVPSYTFLIIHFTCYCNCFVNVVLNDCCVVDKIDGHVGVLLLF